jgi:transposon-encoded protein TnpV
MALTSDQRMHLQSLYAGRHKGFLLDHHPQSYAAMQKAETLGPYLEEIGRQAAQMYETVVERMKAEAKAISSQSEREAYLGSIPLTASEIVHHDIVYARL